MSWFSDAFGGVKTNVADGSELDKSTQDAQALKAQYLALANGQSSTAPQADETLLRNAAQGNAPSAAQMQLQQGQEQNLQNQMAFQASQRGAYNPASARQAVALGAEGSQQVNAQSAQLRAQEMAQARGQLLQAQQGNQNAILQNQGQNNQLQESLRQQAIQALGIQQQDAATKYAGQNQVSLANSASRQAATTGTVGGLISAGGAAVGAAKFAAAHGVLVPGKATVSGDSPVNDTVPAKLSPGELVVPRSVVAQGPHAIAAFSQAAQTPHFGHVLASMAELNQRLAALEAKKGKKSA